MTDSVNEYPQLYWDNFAEDVVAEIDDIAPPERYTKLYCGDVADIFIEKWSTTDGRYICVSYGTFVRQHGLVWLSRKDVEESNNIKLSTLVEWTVPEEHYKKFIARLQDGSND